MENQVHNLLAFFSTETGYVILFIVIIVLTFILVRLFKAFFKKRVLDAVLAAKDPTNYLFFQHIITATIYIAGFSTAFYMIPMLRTLSASLLAGAGIFAVAIGFASQKAFSNIISGLFIVIFKPFRINDRVAVGATVAGIIEDITLRHTVVRSYENKRFVIPNSMISEEIIVNSDITDAEICKFAFFKIDYQSDLQKAKQIIQDLAENHPLTLDKREAEDLENNEPKVMVRVTEWSDFAIIIRASIWAKDSADAFVINCELNESVKAAFDENGITIPVNLLKRSI
jgi:small conductance mechanosensitive channel